VTLGSLVQLGYFFFRQLVRRLTARKSGLAQFEENYAADRLLAMTSEDREQLPSFSGCIACGMCDAIFDAYDRTARCDFRGPSDLPIAYTRNLPDYDALPSYVSNLRKGDLEALERVCPSRIPFRRLALFVERRALDLGAGPAPSTANIVDAKRARGKHDPG
jgi:succinate dehydrogenase/fumarate reductase-like Fe-S protein